MPRVYERFYRYDIGHLTVRVWCRVPSLGAGEMHHEGAILNALDGAGPRRELKAEAVAALPFCSAVEITDLLGDGGVRISRSCSDVGDE